MFVISEEKKWDSWEKKATLSLNTLLRVNNFQKTHRVSVYLTLLSKKFCMIRQQNFNYKRKCDEVILWRPFIAQWNILSRLAEERKLGSIEIVCYTADF